MTYNGSTKTLNTIIYYPVFANTVDLERFTKMRMITESRIHNCFGIRLSYTNS